MLLKNNKKTKKFTSAGDDSNENFHQGFIYIRKHSPEISSTSKSSASHIIESASWSSEVTRACEYNIIVLTATEINKYTRGKVSFTCACLELETFTIDRRTLLTVALCGKAYCYVSKRTCRKSGAALTNFSASLARESAGKRFSARSPADAHFPPARPTPRCDFHPLPDFPTRSTCWTCREWSCSMDLRVVG